MDLRTIHETVKQHPYREVNDERYLSSYKKLLYELSDLFYNIIKNDELFHFAKEMCHDFNWAIRNNVVEHIERCLGVIHEYIDTGNIQCFYTYYDGVNILKASPRLRKFNYDYSQNKFIPEYTKKQLEDMIAEIIEYRNLHPNEKFEYSIYSNERLSFYNSLLKEGLYK